MMFQLLLAHCKRNHRHSLERAFCDTSDTAQYQTSIGH
jgi:hypothetical protein